MLTDSKFEEVLSAIPPFPSCTTDRSYSGLNETRRHRIAVRCIALVVCRWISNNLHWDPELPGETHVIPSEIAALVLMRELSDALVFGPDSVINCLRWSTEAMGIVLDRIGYRLQLDNGLRAEDGRIYLRSDYRSRRRTTPAYGFCMARIFPEVAGTVHNVHVPLTCMSVLLIKKTPETPQ